MMTHEEFMKIEKEWINNEMFYIGELLRYINSLETRIIALENEDPLGLNTSDKLRTQLEERFDCTIHSSQMDLVLEYIYDFLKYKELEAPKNCSNCKYSNQQHMARYWCEELSIKVRPKFSCAYYEERLENETY
jgi:hypothetical protein